MNEHPRLRCLALCTSVVLTLVSLPSTVSAHALAPAVLSLVPNPEDGTVTMTWRAPAVRPTGQALTPVPPTGCEAVGPGTVETLDEGAAFIETTTLRCASPDLLGATVTVEGLESSSVNVVVRLGRADGSVEHAIIDSRSPSYRVTPPEAERSPSFLAYLELGIEHLVTGWDHLTFVLGLLILFGWHRRLVAAITAFTLGHSLTLALSVFGIVSVPQALVEALIALTIVVLALEIQNGGKGLVWKHPWSLPASLGLLHGLGFASVLFDAGLPQSEIPLALLGFNLGLEVGQLAVIAIAFVAYRLVRSLIPARLRDDPTIPAYAIGSIAAYWTIERTLSAFGIVA